MAEIERDSIWTAKLLVSVLMLQYSRGTFLDDNIFDLIVDDMVFFEDKYGQCMFFVAGDFTARIGNQADFVENEFLHKLEMLPDDYVEDIVLNRASQCKVTNEYGNYSLIFVRPRGLE